MKSSFSKLDLMEKNGIMVRLEQRKHFWLLARAGELDGSGKMLLVGDRPGPSAPKERHYHHTPFYSTKHCSGWLNLMLEAEKIPERRLVWINSADENGKYYNIQIVKDLKCSAIIALGGKASAWLKKNGIENFLQIDHPQYWKRFHNKERYPLIEILRSYLASPVSNST